MIRLIVALDINRGIARQGKQPWDIPDDEQYFKEQTLSHGAIVVMGRRTFETLKGPLPGRHNLVVSHDSSDLTGVEVITDLAKLLEECREEKDLWVIGGAGIYAQTISQADELYITEIDADLGCDQFFPAHESLFHLVDQSDEHVQNGYKYRFTRYIKN